MSENDGRNFHGRRPKRRGNYNRQGDYYNHDYRDSRDNRGREYRTSYRSDSFHKNQGTKFLSTNDFINTRGEKFICAQCGEEITDIAGALSKKGSDSIFHFDCVLKNIEASENPKEGEKVIYIGQGRFAVAYFENPSDLRKFEIRKIIEWEDRDKRSPWRTDMATFFSQVK